MPVIKRRPPIIDLLNSAVNQQSQLNETRTIILNRPLSVWYQNNGDGSARIGSVQCAKESLFRYAIALSLYSERFADKRFVKLLREWMWIIALVVITQQASQSDTRINNKADYGFSILDFIVNAFFLLSSLLRVLGLLIRVKIEKAFNRAINVFEMTFNSGLAPFITCILCFIYGYSTDAGLWLRLFRLFFITSNVMAALPRLKVLQSGIANGLRSISYTVLLMIVLILAWAVLGYTLFSENDPFHFGTYGLSALTFFQLSTLENWSTVYYLNFSGCDGYPSEYSGTVDDGSAAALAAARVETSLGVFSLPLCTSPRGMPVASTLIFVSFTVLEGYVIVSMCLAAVAIGFKERLESIRTLQVYGQEEMKQKSFSEAGHAKTGGHAAGAASKLLGGKKERLLIKAALAKCTGDLDEAAPPLEYTKGTSFGASTNALTSGAFLRSSSQAADEGSKKTSGNKLTSKEKSNLSSSLLSSGSATNYAVKLHFIVSTNTYLLLMSSLVLIDGILEICDNISGEAALGHRSSLFGGFVFVQSLLLFDVMFRIISHAYLHDVRIYLSQKQHVFDLLSTVVLFWTIGAQRSNVSRSLRLFRLLRMCRIMMMLSPYLGDLMVIINAIDNSYWALGYVIVLIGIYFLYFAVAGVLLFKNANPYYFKGIGTSFRTLMQVMTQDNWSDVMRKCMLGCKHYGYDTGVSRYDTACNSSMSGRGVGWLAALYFVVFVIMSAMVLANLLVGVIISSMEMLREDFIEESSILDRATRILMSYGIHESQAVHFLKLFEMIDKRSNGFLTFEEFVTLTDAAGMAEAKAHELYATVDDDINGQIDFSEFCEMIAILKTMESVSKTKGKPTTAAEAKSAHDSLMSPAVSPIRASAVFSPAKVANDVKGLTTTPMITADDSVLGANGVKSDDVDVEAGVCGAPTSTPAVHNINPNATAADAALAGSAKSAAATSAAMSPELKQEKAEVDSGDDEDDDRHGDDDEQRSEIIDISGTDLEAVNEVVNRARGVQNTLFIATAGLGQGTGDDWAIPSARALQSGRRYSTALHSTMRKMSSSGNINSLLLQHQQQRSPSPRKSFNITAAIAQRLNPVRIEPLIAGDKYLSPEPDLESGLDQRPQSESRTKPSTNANVSFSAALMDSATCEKLAN